MMTPGDFPEHHIASLGTRSARDSLSGTSPNDPAALQEFLQLRPSTFSRVALRMSPTTTISSVPPALTLKDGDWRSARGEKAKAQLPKTTTAQSTAPSARRLIPA